MENTEEKFGEEILDACIKHTKEVLAEQLPLVKDKKYDFAPQFKDLTIQLYLVGVMQQFYDQYEATTADAQEKAFQALCHMMVKDGVKPNRAKKQAAFVKKMSVLEDGDEALALALGYESKPGDHSLAEVFDHYVGETRVSKGLWRSYDQGKIILLLGGLLFAMAGVWFVTIYLPESDNVTILAIGLLTAFLFMTPVFLIGLLIYRYKTKRGNRPKTPPL
ncbi:hypothetical protein SAMN05216339_10317 [Nitrosomonas eutropha]|uniref:Uncharacterized protein n=1 Tax=Nitrosomonas eutropha TaxID=916 RepID=A0A1I7GK77_9PROT|nr:hypothetical protein [Nitrosomonas eutropha]SFU48834.1 hypothetical protein SAMN05216339_10317 [Nitrosomonas eutropha]